MQGGMMDFPLTLAHILDRAGKLFPKVEIISSMPDKGTHRTTYAAFHERALALAGALLEAGLRPGDRVATLMWNHGWHLEAYFGIPVAGGVLHTLNLRLHPSDIAYIARHAGDRFLIVDDVLLPLYDQFKDEVPFERVIVVPLSGRPVPAPYVAYDDFLTTAPPHVTLPAVAENDALGMCYTSGTTGRPKGVTYSHRSIVLHSFAACLPDMLALSHQDSVLPVVPMFHANAWGLPFAAVMVGSRLVFPGPNLDPETLLDLFTHERVTFSGGVPTIWTGILEAFRKHPGRWRTQPGLRMAVGGSAPEAMIRGFDENDWVLLHAWGMTEIAPLGTVSTVKANLRSLPLDQQYAYRAKQGLPAPFVELRAVSEDGEAPWDGATMGELQVRGPWVAAAYHDPPEDEPGTAAKWTDDGWFRTGDVVTICPEGYVKITDRTKDLIKSGGEWISSVDLENALMAHPKVLEAAVIAVPHPKWDERPLACIVPREGQAPTPDELRDFLADRFAKWWLPDAFEIIDAIPRTSTGKFLKSALRDRFQSHTWPD